MSFSLNKQLENISNYSSIKVGNSIGCVYTITSIQDIKDCINNKKDNSDQLETLFIPIGGGTNTFFGDTHKEITLLKNEIKGIHIKQEFDNTVLLEVGSGEVWDDVVLFAVEHKYKGIEALSAIPGSAGGAVVQNAGAYGSELKDVVNEVYAIHLTTGEERVFSKEECTFSYRKSYFKVVPSEWFIVSFTLLLTKVKDDEIVVLPEYNDVKRYFEEKDIHISLQSIRDVIISIRWSKLPHPETIPNCGSWFTNPIVPKGEAYNIIKNYESVPHWIINDTSIKLSAGWLIDQVFGKGYSHNGFTLYEKNALIITNPHFISDVQLFFDFETHIIKGVKEKFGVLLEREPVCIR